MVSGLEIQSLLSFFAFLVSLICQGSLITCRELKLKSFILSTTGLSSWWWGNAEAVTEWKNKPSEVENSFTLSLKSFICTTAFAARVAGWTRSGSVFVFIVCSTCEFKISIISSQLQDDVRGWNLGSAHLDLISITIKAFSYSCRSKLYDSIGMRPNMTGARSCSCPFRWSFPEFGFGIFKNILVWICNDTKFSSILWEMFLSFWQENNVWVSAWVCAALLWTWGTCQSNKHVPEPSSYFTSSCWATSQNQHRRITSGVRLLVAVWGSASRAPQHQADN